MTRNTELVSIIMNCFNSDKYLKEAIDSIYAQTYDNWEIIFWDNGSTDNSSSIANSYDERLKYFFSEKTTPLGEARNLALREANGDYIAFLDCDDLYLPDKIQIQLAAMQASRAVLSYGSWIEINEEGEQKNAFRLRQYNGDVFERLMIKYNVNFQTLIIQRNFLEKNKINFDTKLQFSPDLKLVMEISYISSKVVVLDEFLVKYRVHGSSMSSRYRQDKYDNLDSIMSYFIGKGACYRYPDFYRKALFRRYRVRILDAVHDHNYLKVLIHYFNYSIYFLQYRITGKMIDKYNSIYQRNL
jgi:glycosyltransferase involved in cell wall biosynthesis